MNKEEFGKHMKKMFMEKAKEIHKKYVKDKNADVVEYFYNALVTGAIIDSKIDEKILENMGIDIMKKFKKRINRKMKEEDKDSKHNKYGITFTVKDEENEEY